MKSLIKNNWLSLTAIAISVIAIICSVRNNPFEISFEGALITGVATILSVPTAIVIGFQIYNYFKIKSIRDEISKNKEEIIDRSNENLMYTYSGLSYFYFTSYSNIKHQKSQKEQLKTFLYGGMQYSIFTLYQCVILNNAALFEKTIKTMNTYNSDLYILDKDKISTLLSCIDTIDELWKTDNFKVIYNKIKEHESQ